MTSINAIGLMSGTSMDGIDCALIRTDGARNTQSLGGYSYKYDAKAHNLLKEAERSTRLSQGHKISSKITRLSTCLHIQAVKNLLAKYNLSAQDIAVIGYHGQTLYHNAAQKITVQVGNADWMAKETQIAVVNNFRNNDIIYGGQGAPFAPLYHQALAKCHGLTRVAIINCGGIANITIVDGEKLVGFDAGPGNALLDAFIKQKTAEESLMDVNGHYGLRGKVHPDLLELLYAYIASKNCQDYFARKPPKSLDIGDMVLPAEIFNLNIYDGARTLAAFTAQTMVDSLNLLENITCPSLFLLCGGGWYNLAIKKEFSRRLQAKIKNAQVKTTDALGWPNQYLEAEIFAYLAVRHLKKLPLSLPEITGVCAPMLGGDLHTYK